MTRIPHDQMADELDGMIYSKATWLADFGQGRNKRPEYEVEKQRRYLDVLRQAAEDYRNARKRDAGQTKARTATNEG